MKTQAWGWLTAAVLAAGLNSSYHNGGMPWAHEIVDRVQHNSSAVFALATGRANQFLAEARMLNADRTVESAMNAQEARCPFATRAADLQESFDQSQDQFQSKLDSFQSKFDHFQAMSDREQARVERFAANRVRIENQVRARLARVRISQANFVPVVVRVPEIDCPRVRVNIPSVPRIKVPAPEVRVNYSGPGPI